jgi:DNA modification methylase
LVESIRNLGLLQPIGIDKENNLVYGYHRLEACKRLGWEEIPVVVLDGGRDRLEYELMEIDENLVRAELTEFEKGKLLARRKEIYDQLYPERRWGYASLKNLKPFRNTEVSVNRNFCEGEKVKRDFVSEVSEELGMSKTAIYEYLEIGQRIKGEVEDMIRGTELEDRKMDLLKISQLDPEEQKYVVKRVLEKDETVKEAIEELERKKRLQKSRERRKELEKLEKELEEQDIKILLGDMRVLIKDVPDNSVDLIFTDPPYATKYFELYSVLASEGVRVLKPGGFLITLVGQFLFQEIILEFSKYLKYYWVGGVYLSEGHKIEIGGWNILNKWRPILIYYKPPLSQVSFTDFLLSEKKEKEFHDWQFTLKEAEYFIDRFSLPGDLVLDPFMGTGTFAIACMRKKRKFLGFEANEENYNIASDIRKSDISLTGTGNWN